MDPKGQSLICNLLLSQTRSQVFKAGITELVSAYMSLPVTS